MKYETWDKIMSELYSNSFWLPEDLRVDVERAGTLEDRAIVLLVPVELVVKLLYEECPPEVAK